MGFFLSTYLHANIIPRKEVKLRFCWFVSVVGLYSPSHDSSMKQFSRSHQRWQCMSESELKLFHCLRPTSSAGVGTRDLPESSSSGARASVGTSVQARSEQHGQQSLHVPTQGASHSLLPALAFTKPEQGSVAKKSRFSMFFLNF